METTDEQEAILACNGTCISIQAFAGTGKTTTLEHYCRIYPQTRFLYLCFNKTAQEDAKKRFPPNVICSTIDSLCFHMSKSTTKKPISFRYSLIKNELTSPKHQKIGLWNIYNQLDYFVNRSTCKTFQGTNASTLEAKALWNRYVAGKTKWICHEMNRKLCLLKEQETVTYLCQYFDSILIDECQDLNPIMLAIIQYFPKQRIFVGDMHQAIYGFMGNINAFHKIKPTHHFTLSKTFRFGPLLASYVTALLPQGSIQAFFQQLPFFLYDPKDAETFPRPATILSRYNKTCFFESFDLVSKGFAIHWLPKKEFFQRIHTFLEEHKQPDRWNRIRKTAEEDADFETLGLMNLVESIKQQKLKEMMQQIDQGTKPKSQADYILSTVHKAKGMEWNHVIVSQDIRTAIEKAEQRANPPRPFFDKTTYVNEEKNIYYVAITRAKHSLLDYAKKENVSFQ